MKTANQIERILTISDRLNHIKQSQERELEQYGEIKHAPDFWDRVGDVATMESNKFHNPETGFKEFYPDTPLWIIRLAVGRGWASLDNLFSIKSCTTNTLALADYLADYVNTEIERNNGVYVASDVVGWIGGGIEAFESTENVKIKIESEA